MRRRSAAALGAVAALLLAACGRGEPATAVRGSSAEEASTTAVPTTASTTTTVGRAATTTTRRPSTTATRPATTATTTAAAKALTPAAPGTYRYTTAGATTFGGTTVPFPAVTTLVVDPPSGTRQHLARNLRDASGNGLATEFVLDYRPEGLFLVSLRLTVGVSGVANTRDLAPASPVLLVATGARPGAHAEADLAGAGSTARLVVDLTGEEPVTVAGQPVGTLVLRATVTLAPGDVTGRQSLTINLDPASRLWVKERSVADASAAGGLFTLHSEYTATLQRLTP